MTEKTFVEKWRFSLPDDKICFTGLKTFDGSTDEGKKCEGDPMTGGVEVPAELASGTYKDKYLITSCTATEI